MEVELVDEEAPVEPPVELDEFDDNFAVAPTKTKKNKRIILAIAGVAIFVAVGLGLGFGLKGNGSSDVKNASGAIENADFETSSVAVDSVVDESEEEVSTIKSTTTAITEATVSSSSSETTHSTITATIAATDLAKVDGTSEDVVADTTDTENVNGADILDDVTEATAPVTDAPTNTTTDAAPAAPVMPTETYDAVIIGAGWAGIRAAETLLNSGITSILVLEATDYIGGRSKSVNLDGTINDPTKVGSLDNSPIDLGSEWLYSRSSPMHRAFAQNGYLAPLMENGGGPGTTPLETGMVVFYQQFENGTADLLEGADELMEEVWHNGFLQYRDNQDDADALEGLSYAQSIDKYIDSSNITDKKSLQFLNLMEDAMEIEYTGDSSQISVEGIEFFPEGYTSSSTNYLSIPGIGFGNVAAEYAEPIKSYIQLNSKVTEINSENESTFVRYVENGVEKAVNAKTVLITVSLGVLKAGNIKFVPNLPAWKQEVIDEMGFNIVNKCIMSWDKDEDIVWPRDHSWFVIMTPEDETSGHWTTFLNSSPVKGRPVLTAWAGGNEAIEIEKQSDDEILSVVMNNLRSMFPSIREPDKFIISRWGSDENFRGTYSFPVPGRNFYNDADDLSWPLRTRAIWFAGEATGSDWGTTGGAWKTGENAAEEMAESLLIEPE